MNIRIRGGRMYITVYGVRHKTSRQWLEATTGRKYARYARLTIPPGGNIRFYYNQADAERSLGLWLRAAAFDNEYDLDRGAYEIVPLEITIP